MAEKSDREREEQIITDYNIRMRKEEQERDEQRRQAIADGTEISESPIQKELAEMESRQRKADAERRERANSLPPV